MNWKVLGDGSFWCLTRLVVFPETHAGTRWNGNSAINLVTHETCCRTSQGGTSYGQSSSNRTQHRLRKKVKKSIVALWPLSSLVHDSLDLLVLLKSRFMTCGQLVRTTSPKRPNFAPLWVAASSRFSSAQVAPTWSCLRFGRNLALESGTHLRQFIWTGKSKSQKWKERQWSLDLSTSEKNTT